jgi:hypothetical protein
MAREIFTDWTDEALDAAISQLKALRFSTGLSVREQMKIVLHAAERAQREDELTSQLNKSVNILLAGSDEP